MLDTLSPKTGFSSQNTPSDQCLQSSGGNHKNRLKRPVSEKRQKYYSGGNLSQRDAAVVGRDALVPMRTKTFLPQPGDGSLGEIPILETSAGQRHLPPSHALGHRDRSFDQRVMKLGGNFAC